MKVVLAIPGSNRLEWRGAYRTRSGTRVVSRQLRTLSGSRIHGCSCDAALPYGVRQRLKIGVFVRRGLSFGVRHECWRKGSPFTAVSINERRKEVDLRIRRIRRWVCCRVWYAPASFVPTACTSFVVGASFRILAGCTSETGCGRRLSRH